MKISYSRYTAFLKNPERFRLYYMLGLTPDGDEAPSRKNLGRRRGRCFHEMLEGVSRDSLVKEYGAELVIRCEDMREVVPPLSMDWVEREFEIPILDGKHSITGRIDHRFSNRDDVRQLGDFKTTKGTRTKKEVNEYLGELLTSSQSHFYLRAEREFAGTSTGLFTYHVIFDKKDKEHKPTYCPLELPYTGPAEVDRTMAEVYAAAEAIEFLEHTYGTEKPWPHSNNWPCCGDRLFCGYEGICGRMMPKGCVPEGYTSRWKEQIQGDTGETQ